MASSRVQGQRVPAHLKGPCVPLSPHPIHRVVHGATRAVPSPKEASPPIRAVGMEGGGRQKPCQTCADFCFCFVGASL